MKYLLLLSLVSIQSFAGTGGGGSPACTGPGETKVSWPVIDPIWEMCYLSPQDSVGARGSSLEIRDVYLNGYYAIERAHVPMLFANYQSGTCYRDWIDSNSGFLRPNPSRTDYPGAVTTCDISNKEDEVVGNCPFDNLDGPGKIGSPSDCVTGVIVEMFEDKMILTTNHSAAWYKYSSRFTFYADGRIAPRFGFGNSDGTNAQTTHWHHAYWRINFDIDGAAGDNVVYNGTPMTTEFVGFRGQDFARRSWLITDKNSGLGFRVEATPEDYLLDVNTPPFNPNNYHNTDIMVTKYRQIGALPEYSDTPGSNSLSNCSMNEDALVNGENISNEDIVFWYRTAVTDLANMGLVCKFGGPIFYPTGDWGIPPPDPILHNGFES